MTIGCSSKRLKNKKSKRFLIRCHNNEKTIIGVVDLLMLITLMKSSQNNHGQCGDIATI